VIAEAHPKEFIEVKLQQTVFPKGLDKYIGKVCTAQKNALDNGLAPLRLFVKQEECYFDASVDNLVTDFLLQTRPKNITKNMLFIF